jgi:hypothetical protein
VIGGLLTTGSFIVMELVTTVNCQVLGQRFVMVGFLARASSAGQELVVFMVGRGGENGGFGRGTTMFHVKHFWFCWILW